MEGVDAPIHCFPTMHPKRLRYQVHSTIEKILTITYVYWEALELGIRILKGFGDIRSFEVVVKRQGCGGAVPSKMPRTEMT